METRGWLIPVLLLSVLAAGAVGYVATRISDQRTIERLTTERDTARDCRRSGASVAPCPVVYRNTKIEWHDRIQTVQTPDPQQSARIAALSAELASAHRAIRNLARRQLRPRIALARGWQNGTRQYPYNTDERCPAGSVIVYDTGLSGGGNAGRYSGDPDVCYVLTKLHRLALSSSRR